MMQKFTPYRLLCALLVSIYLLHSIGIAGVDSEVFADSLSSLLIIVLLRTCWNKSRFRGAAVLIAALTALCFWVDSLILPSVLRLVSLGMLSLIEIACILVILRDVLNNKAVAADDIFGCVGAYLLAGFAMAGVFEMIESVCPGSFHFSAETTKSFSCYLYLSFMNLTTLGYGDILPAQDLSRALCVLQAAYGQLYIAVVIAHLMGFHLHARLSRGSAETSALSETQ